MNTNITREELYDKFVTKEYLTQSLDNLLTDIRSMLMDVADMLNSKINDTNARLDHHIMQNALEHSKFKNTAQGH